MKTKIKKPKNTYTITGHKPPETPQYDQTKRTKLIEFIKEHGDQRLACKLRSKNNDLFNWIIESTNICLSDPYYTFQTKVFWIVNDIHTFPLCTICKKTYITSCNVHRDKTNHIEHMPIYCSLLCSCHDPQRSVKILETYRKHYKPGDTTLQKKREETIIKKYGSLEEFYKIHTEKLKETSMRRYGVSNPSKLDAVKAKWKRTKLERYGDQNYNNSQQAGITNLERYGNVCSLHSPENEEKTKQTWMERYGVDHIGKSKSLHDKSQQTMLERYGCINPFQMESTKQTIAQYKLEHGKEMAERMRQTKASWSEEHKESITQQTRSKNLRSSFEKLKEEAIYAIPLFSADDLASIDKERTTLLKWHCTICGKDFDAPYKRIRMDGVYHYGKCPYCFAPGRSVEEKSVQDFIETIAQGEIVHNKQFQDSYTMNKRYEFDIYIPSAKVAVEYDGLYFHTIDRRNNGYHLAKTQLAERMGVSLMHVRSDMWKYDRERTQNIIKALITHCKIDDFIPHENRIYIDRSTFNKCVPINGYVLVGETEPEIISCQDGSASFEYETCGQLIYDKTDGSN